MLFYNMPNEVFFPFWCNKFSVTKLINPLHANVPILYPLKTPENLKFSGVFRGYKMGALA